MSTEDINFLLEKHLANLQQLKELIKFYEEKQYMFSKLLELKISHKHTK